ncbi:MAG: polysaccharide deacetylase family protein, partial [Calditrichaeota bacterium]|nr:polysaccharide deacetylase family protein [Calditrichota bacterium]
RPSSDAVLFTFDDGYADNWYHAAPILNEAGIKAAFFITTGFVAGTHPLWWDVLLASVQQAALEKVAELPKIEEEATFATLAEEIASLPTERRLAEANRLVSVLKNTASTKRLTLVRKFAEAWNGEEPLKKLALPKALTWQQIQSLHRQGHGIGAHTVSHADLGMLGPEQIREEIVQSVLALERVTRARVRMFAYPSGMPNPHTKRKELNQILSEVGIELAFCTSEGWNEPGTDPLLISRVNMTDMTLTDSQGRFSEDCFYAVVGGFFRRGGALRRKIRRVVRGRS